MWVKKVAVAVLSFGIVVLLVLGITRFGGIVTARILVLDLRVLSVVTLSGLAIMLACVFTLRRNRRKPGSGN